MVPHSIAPGDLLSSRFEVQEFIGQGGMGAVYRAYDRELREVVALKAIRPELAANHELQSRLRREIKHARAITHPHVCRVHDLYSHVLPDGDRVLFLTMEYLQGEPLSQRLAREGRLPLAFARAVFQEVASGLDAAHRRGIVHRDLKPGNVMLVPDGAAVRAVITDFGLATRIHADASTETALSGDRRAGTLPYMAPEQLEGGTVGAHTDVYALGLLTFELLTGRRAWTGPGAPPRGFMPPPPSTIFPDIDRSWDAVIRQCLSADPSRRFASALDAVSRLTGTADRPDQRKTAWHLWTTAVAVVLLAIAGGATIMLRSTPSERPRTAATQFYETGVRALRDGSAYKASAALQRAAELDPGDPIIHAGLAEAAIELDHLERAQHEVLLAIDASKKRPLAERDALRLDAIRATAMRQFPHAVTLYEQLAVSATESERASALLDLGRAYERAGQSEAALSHYRKAASDSAVAFPAAHLRLGALLARLQKHDEAHRHFAEAEQLYGALGEYEGVVEVMYQRALALNRREQIEPATALLSDALAKARSTGNPYQQIRILFQLSTAAYLAGKGEEGYARAGEALKLARANGIENLVTRALLEMGNSSQRMARRADAEEFFNEAFQLATRYGLRRDEARARLSLASLKTEIGRPSEAIVDAQSAITYYEPAGFRRETALAHMIVGRASRQLGDYDAAARAFRAQLDSARQLGDAAMLDYAHEGLASVLYAQQHYPEALLHLREVLRLREKTDSAPDIADANVNLAETLIGLGDLRQAQRHLATARKLLSGEASRAVEHRVLLAEARLALTEWRLAEARRIASRALVSAERASDKAAIHALRLISALAAIRSGDSAGGRRACEQVLADARAQSDSALTVAANLCLAEAATADSGSEAVLDTLGHVIAESKRLGFIEWEWHAELLAAKLARRTGNLPVGSTHTKNAGELEDRLRRVWGKDAFQRYTSRRDVQHLRDL